MKWKEIRQQYTWSRVRTFIRKDIIESEDSNQRIVFSIMTGSFMAILPFWGFQSLLAVLIAMRFRLSKLITFAFSTISIPCLPFVLFGSYMLGALALNQQLVYSLSEISKSMLGNILIPYLIGSIILALAVAGLLGTVFGIILHFSRKRR